MSGFTIRTSLFLALAMLTCGVASASESVACRLTDWHDMHFDDVRKADRHLAAVKKLACEAQTDAHNGHTDVRYRSLRWRSLEVADDQLAHEWEDWMQAAGFETLHGHAADHGSGHSRHEGHDHSDHDHGGHSHAGHNHGPGEAEEVAYRMDDWQTLHIEDDRRGAAFIAMMKGLGCEVRSDAHDRHADVRVRCHQWKHIELTSHRSAQNREKWLGRQGFAVRHKH